MTQYLILHKVRGEPSFDCAEEIEPGMWITNSGYRAYPYAKWPLHELVNDELEVPADWPDHFEVRGEKIQPKIDIGAMFAKLIPPIRRRI
jgi:hypothetical protein